MSEDSTLTERQKKWFASVKASLQTRTGKTLEEWVEVGRAMPPGLKPRQKIAWFKAEHGLLQNSAAFVLGEMEGGAKTWDDEAGAARAALWADPAQRAILEAVETKAKALQGVVSGQRKAFTAFSRTVQFAAVRPLKKGGAALGLALEPDADPRLAPVKKESWSERLHAVLDLPDAAAVDAGVAALLKAAWERS